MTLSAGPSMYSPPPSVPSLASISASFEAVRPSPEAAPRSATRRPTNVARTVFHLASGGVALALVRILPTRGWLVAASALFAVAAWSCEITRRRSDAVNRRIMRLFGPVAHAHEWREVNSATWYATALILMALVVPLPAAEVGVVVLAVADPMAGLVGRRFGRHRLASGRSLEGALAFVVSGALASLGWMYATGTYEGSRLAVAAVASLAGALIELFVAKVDDNLAIPLGTSLVVTLASLALGLG